MSGDQQNQTLMVAPLTTYVMQTQVEDDVENIDVNHDIRAFDRSKTNHDKTNVKMRFNEEAIKDAAKNIKIKVEDAAQAPSQNPHDLAVKSEINSHPHLNFDQQNTLIQSNIKETQMQNGVLEDHTHTQKGSAAENVEEEVEEGPQQQKGDNDDDMVVDEQYVTPATGSQQTYINGNENENQGQIPDNNDNPQQNRALPENIIELLDVLKDKYGQWERQREAMFSEEKFGAMIYGFVCGYLLSKNLNEDPFTFQQPLDQPRLLDRQLDSMGQGFGEPSIPIYNDEMMNYMLYNEEQQKQRTSDQKKRAAQELHGSYGNGDRILSFPSQLHQNPHFMDTAYIPDAKRPRSSRSSAGPYGSSSSREEKIGAYKQALGVQREGVLELFQKQPWCERQKPNTVHRQWQTLQTYLLREPNWYKQWREFSVVSKAAVLSRVSNNSDRLDYVLETKPEKSSMYQILTRSDQEFNKKYPHFRDWMKLRKEVFAQMGGNRNFLANQLSLPL
eukprot:TRINITY_DN13965_c0_g3_i1.p1 TRINITY_DN13965_c0_g3~~TRINITY_DN13965_c0_g3_i1.p1  ORF type:complete len:502 (-),score=68.80 TRINITY_DN13965_c0_g3_i1:181-1686(-)